MGKGGSVVPGPPSHRGLVFEIVSKQLSAGSCQVNIRDLELISNIKHVFPVVELDGSDSTSLLSTTAFGIDRNTTDDSSVTIELYKGLVMDVSILVAGY